MDPIEFFEKASAWAEQKVKAVSADQLGDDTPCTEWDVKALVNHVIGGLTAVAIGAAGKKADPKALEKDYVDGDAGKAFSKARTDAIKAVQGSEDVLGKTFDMPWGEMPAPFALMILGADSLIHGHDVAKATDQDTKMPEDVAKAAYEMMRENMANFERGDAFSDEVKVPDNAPVQDKLLAFSGRKP